MNMGRCDHCGYTVRLCKTCQAILPEEWHGSYRYCADCREINRSEYNRTSQIATRERRQDWQKRVEELERQLSAT